MGIILSSFSITNETISNNPIAIMLVIFLGLSFVLPCILWFIRNYLRIIHKKDFEILNLSLKWFVLGGFILFLISLLFLILIVAGII